MSEENGGGDSGGFFSLLAYGSRDSGGLDRGIFLCAY